MEFFCKVLDMLMGQDKLPQPDEVWQFVYLTEYGILLQVIFYHWVF